MPLQLQGALDMPRQRQLELAVLFGEDVLRPGRQWNGRQAIFSPQDVNSERVYEWLHQIRAKAQSERSPGWCSESDPLFVEGPLPPDSSPLVSP